ncbi:carbohydrate kinase family protein [Actinoplanes sp. NPDC026619]|uniref:carbohydrate kinase family protein n=1 Tax=Actinoplanes sp. NPDC026619 TaxID=3155798 RepID=UPI0033F2FD73
MGADPLDLVCFSYLADAQVMRVDAYPRANGGAMVNEVVASIAGDGPLTAVTAAQLGLHTALISNDVGNDPTGDQLHSWLDATGVAHSRRRLAAGMTPQIAVVDDTRTRTWFAALDHAFTGLERADLTLLGEAGLAYIDCYQAITTGAARAIRAAGETPLMLNLGGDPLDDTISAAARGRRVAVVQTSLGEADNDRAETIAGQLLDRLLADTAVVTLGSLGALAVTRTGLHRVAAEHVTVSHTHGAGAAFSAGYAHALISGADVPAALGAGCAVGTRHCTSPAAPVPRRLPALAA